MGETLNPWFQTWSQPTYPPQIFHEPVTRLQYPQNTFQYEAEGRMGNFLPYLLALGMMTPSSFSESAPAAKIAEEATGPFNTVYQWSTLDFEFPTTEARLEAISKGTFIEANNLPLGLDVWQDRIFVSMPKWKPGVPATLAWLPKNPVETSPLLRPYPNWDWHTSESCAGITSVFRMQVDDCGRLWVLDSGLIDVTIKPVQACPPQILIFDLSTDELIQRHVLKDEFIKEDSLYSNIIVDVRDGDCENVHAYLTDVWRFGLLVYSLRRDKSWRVTNHLFYPDPIAAAYTVQDLDFSWTDGIFGLALSPYDKELDDRILYFHPMSSFREFYVKTSVICNETGWEEAADEFKVLGQSRGKSGHTSASAMDQNGILYFNFVSRDSVGCWDSRKAYKRDNIGIVAKNSTTMVFPNDLRLDKEERQGIWIISNRLPFYLYRGLDSFDINFRIMHAYTDDAIKDTICDPYLSRPDSYQEFSEDIDCY